MASIGGDITQRLFNDAGITAGMRVLDLGCGQGDVSVLAAKFVGDQGAVLGVDRDPDAIKIAKENIQKLGFNKYYLRPGRSLF
jgi:ubiquinone/menaquinone biosynthesis C-methylase UbiE